MSSSIVGSRTMIRRKVFLNTFPSLTLLPKNKATFLAIILLLGFTFEASEIAGLA